MVLDIYICRHWKPGWLETGQVGDKVGGVTTGGQWTASSGPDGTDDGGCERDWGFETHSRRTFTRVTRSEASETALGEVGNTDRHPTTDGHRRPSDGRLERAFSFSHYTTEGIFIHGDPPLGSFLEPPRPRAATSETRDHALEWEFSLTIPGNAFITA